MSETEHLKDGEPCEHDDEHVHPTGVGQTEDGRQYVVKTCYECWLSWDVWEEWELGASDSH